MGVSLKSPQTMTDGCREDAISRAMVSACGARMADASASLCSSYNGSVLYELKLNEDTITLINNHLE